MLLSSLRRSVVLVVALLALVAAACASPNPLSADGAARINQLRAAHGLRQLPRSIELDIKAQAQAQRMAGANTIFHSSSLTAGVSQGWQLIGENVAMAGSVAQAQKALEASPPHRENLLNAYFTEMGVGAVQRGNLVFVVQVFVQR